MTHPASEPTPARDRRSFGRLWWPLFLVLVVYPLSPGPLARAFQICHLRLDPLVTFYTPLSYASDNSKGVRRFYDWYLEMWWPQRPARK